MVKKGFKMKLLIIRHGDPDYSIDSLTEKGWKEAEFLADKIEKISVSDFYVSPLGRARDTASVTLNRLGRTAQTMEWLREFVSPITNPVTGESRMNCWDWKPKDWTAFPEFYDRNQWIEVPCIKDGAIDEEFQKIVEGFDQLLRKHGYVREKEYYRAEKANDDTIVLFCHFGVLCVMLSHLTGISPMLLWHGFCAAPTSVTTIVTEEREEGIAYFRTSAFGDISHLYAADEEPAFAARFCEKYENWDERH